MARSLLRALLVVWFVIASLPGLAELAQVSAGFTVEASRGAAVPEIAAENAVIIAEPGGVVLFDLGMHTRVPPASLTKVMTAHLALRRADLSLRLTVARADLVGQASMGLQVGQTLSLETLLHGLLLPSGNDAAMTIARGLGAQPGDDEKAAVARFVGWMNDEAARLGLTATHFVNPHGLDAPGHLSSAHDLARLALVAWQEPRLARIAGRLSYRGDGYALQHGHALVGRYPGVLGGKTGRTRGCRSCLLTVAERNGRRLAIVVLRDTPQQTASDTINLLEWATGQPLAPGTPLPTRPPSTLPPPRGTPPLNASPAPAGEIAPPSTATPPPTVISLPTLTPRPPTPTPPPSIGDTPASATPQSAQPASPIASAALATVSPADDSRIATMIVAPTLTPAAAVVTPTGSQPIAGPTPTTSLRSGAGSPAVAGGGGPATDDNRPGSNRPAGGAESDRPRAAGLVESETIDWSLATGGLLAVVALAGIVGLRRWRR